MSTDESQKARAEMRDEQYESTVLDFLDKEIAAAQPVQKQKDPSEDLDALVSDLMKQVITESFELKEPPASKELPETPVAPHQSKMVLETARETQDKKQPVQAVPVQAVNAAALKKEEPAKKAESARPVEKSAGVRPPALLKPQAKPRRMIPVIAFASLCLLASIGVVIYYSGSGGKVPAAQSAPATPASVTPAKSQTAAPVTPVNQTTVSSQPQTAPSSIKPRQPETKPASVGNPSGPAKTPEVPVPVANKSAEPKTGPVEKPRPENPPSPPATASVVPVTPAPLERTPAPAPAPAPPETSSLINGTADRSAEKPLAPISSQVESFSSPIVSTNSNARQMIAAVPVSQASPSFPEVAARTRASGSVVLELDIDAQGKVVKATPVSGPTIFYNAAVSAAMQWRYKPASINGTNIKSQSRVTMVFNLRK